MEEQNDNTHDKYVREGVKSISNFRAKTWHACNFDSIPSIYASHRATCSSFSRFSPSVWPTVCVNRRTSSSSDWRISSRVTFSVAYRFNSSSNLFRAASAPFNLSARAFFSFTTLCHIHNFLSDKAAVR